jgi:biotin synthase
MKKDEIIRWLKETDEVQLAELWQHADEVRRHFVGDQVHLRGLIEFSNICVRQCAYCGLRAGNRSIQRYRMTAGEILQCALEAEDFGYGTVVLQSGEDPGVKAGWMADLIRLIKRDTSLAVTLSLGERCDEELALWREAGADRYLLRFETSNQSLFERIHPSLPEKRSDRIAILKTLKELGYEVGSGVMIGIPGQTYDNLARDILMFRQLDLDMIGVGPFLPSPNTPLGDSPEDFGAEKEAQVPNSEVMTYKVIALSRIVCQKANIPSTTALATINLAEGRELGLMRGANIVMPNMTPPEYRREYQIYPDKACISETARDCRQCMKRRIVSIGREVGTGRGDSPNKVGVRVAVPMEQTRL